jgi:hypothetical protein
VDAGLISRWCCVRRVKVSGFICRRAVLHLSVLFIHLLATCIALGAILATDLRLLGKLADYRMRISPPNPFVTRLVGVSLLLLCASGAALVWVSLQERSDSLQNPKLQAKLLLVAMRAANALVLHAHTFPRLARGKRLKPGALRDMLGVGVPVALSNCLWLFTAFLGIARPWNHSMPMGQILFIALALFVVTLAGVMLLLVIAARDRPSRRRADWIDGLKARLRGVARMLRVAPGGSAAKHARAYDSTHLLPRIHTGHH